MNIPCSAETLVCSAPHPHGEDGRVCKTCPYGSNALAEVGGNSKEQSRSGRVVCARAQTTRRAQLPQQTTAFYIIQPQLLPSLPPYLGELVARGASLGVLQPSLALGEGLARVGSHLWSRAQQSLQGGTWQGSAGKTAEGHAITVGSVGCTIASKLQTLSRFNRIFRLISAPIRP